MKKFFEKLIMWIIIILFIAGGIYVGILIGHEIWSWFNTPGQATAYRNRTSGEVTVYADTSFNPFWDIVFGFLGLSGGAFVGAGFYFLMIKCWELITKRKSS
jgi:hypothetical protein